MKKIHTFYRTVKLVEHPLVTNIYGNNYYLFVVDKNKPKRFSEYYDNFGILSYKERIVVYEKEFETESEKFIMGKNNLLKFHLHKIDLVIPLTMAVSTFRKIDKYDKKKKNEFITKKFQRAINLHGFLIVEDENKILNLIRNVKLCGILGGGDIPLE